MTAWVIQTKFDKPLKASTLFENYVTNFNIDDEGGS